MKVWGKTKPPGTRSCSLQLPMPSSCPALHTDGTLVREPSSAPLLFLAIPGTSVGAQSQLHLAYKAAAIDGHTLWAPSVNAKPTSVRVT